MLGVGLLIVLIILSQGSFAFFLASKVVDNTEALLKTVI